MKLTVYGNEIPKKELRLGTLLCRYYKRKYGFKAHDYPALTSVPHALGKDDFNLMSITQKKVPDVCDKTADTFGAAPSGSVCGASDAWAANEAPFDTKKGIVLGTMRMGFGHCRIAIALASAAHHAGCIPYWFDMLSFPDSAAGKTIRSLEYWYNLASRVSQKSALFNNTVWEKLTSTAGQHLSSSLQNGVMADMYAALFRDIPPLMPFLSTHPWVGHGAVGAGLQHIITVVPDNYPLAFHIVEGSVHAVQSPSSFMDYRTLFDMAGKTDIKHCMPQNDIFEAGHFVDHEIVSNIEYDCELRRKRMKDGKARLFLLTMGGAGAQVAKFAGIAKAQKSAVEQKKAALLINMGDHKGRWADLQKEFKAAGILWTMHDDWQKTRAFIDDIREHDVHGVHVFLHDDFYAAVYATNLLMRVCDVMITKPSELSFYPVPKLFIHRVGRHEAWGAIRSSECGDGTIETEASSDLYRTLRVLTSDTDLLDLYCTHIIKNNKQGIYNGAYKVVQKALESTKL